ncbi:MAG: DUF2490 domain-containing protein [Opitutales bacterium]
MTLANETRVIGDGFLGFWLFQPKASYRLNSNWQFALGGAYGESRSCEDGPWNSFGRLELEANPRVNLTVVLRFDFRVRTDIRWEERRDYDPFPLLRLRTRLTWQADTGPLRSLAAANEIFYHFEDDLWSENRFLPVIATWNLFEGHGSTPMLCSARADPRPIVTRPATTSSALR